MPGYKKTRKNTHSFGPKKPQVNKITWV